MRGCVVARWALGAVATTLLTVFLATCGSGPSPEDGGDSATPSPGATVVSSSPDIRVFLPTVPELDSVPTARAGGKLVLDGRGCLKIKGSGRGVPDLVPVWPSTFRLDTADGKVRILDGKRVVAQVGKMAVVSGGETDTQVLRGNGMGEHELRELARRCPDYYWLVGSSRVPENVSGSASATAAPVPDVVGMRVEEACRTLERAGGNAYIFGKRDAEGSVKPGQIVEQRPLAPGPEDPPNTVLFVAKPFPDMLPKDTSCSQRKVGLPG